MSHNEIKPRRIRIQWSWVVAVVIALGVVGFVAWLVFAILANETSDDLAATDQQKKQLESVAGPDAEVTLALCNGSRGAQVAKVMKQEGQCASARKLLRIVDDPDPNDPEINDPDPDDPDPNDPEIQDRERQEREVQEAEIQDPENPDDEINDPDPDDPEIQDEEIQEPEEQEAEIQEDMLSFTFTFTWMDNTWTFKCTDADKDRHFECEEV
jgi:hypothetical protein